MFIPSQSSSPNEPTSFRPSLRHRIAWRAVVGGFACGLVCPLLFAPVLTGEGFPPKDPLWAVLAQLGQGVFVVGLVSTLVGLVAAVNARLRLVALPLALAYLGVAGFFYWLLRR